MENAFERRWEPFFFLSGLFCGQRQSLYTTALCSSKCIYRKAQRENKAQDIQVFIGTSFSRKQPQIGAKEIKGRQGELIGFTAAFADSRQSDGANGRDSVGGSRQRDREHSKERSTPLVRLRLLRAGRQVSC